MTGGPVAHDEHVAIHRIRIERSAYYAVQAPEAEASASPTLVIAIHGYGQSCKGFIKNFEPLLRHPYLVVAPQGPNQFYWERRRVGFAWVTRYMFEDTLGDNLAYLDRLVREVRGEHSCDPARIFLVGFSQGAVMACRFAASGLVKPDGLVICGADLPKDVQERLGDLEPFPVRLVHGEGDEMMKIEKARQAEAELSAHGFDVETDYFEGGHEIPPGRVEAIAEWMARKSGSQAKKD